MGTVTVSSPLAELGDRGLSREMRELELPEVQVIGPWQTKRPTRKAMLSGRFYVYGSATQLDPPIDWQAESAGSRTWRYELQTLCWLKEALARHAGGGDVETLAVARDVAIDWARQHLRETEGVSEFAWYDMAVGLRAPYIGYTLRACLGEGMLEDEDAGLLLAAALRHGEELARGESYAAGNNHGLFQDEGLYLLARQLPELPGATAWRELALTRMRRTLRQTIDFEEGAHLEHSPAYQLAMVEMAARLASNVRELPELNGLLGRMRRTAAWQTTPAGRMAQLGDTDDLPAPAWVRDTATRLHGLNPLFGAGQAFAREGGSYLAVSAADHGPAHKHSDDSGLLLIEDGVTVLGDAGRWGYYEDEPDRVYARSARAHNVLAVDGEEFGWRGAEPYGSGLVAAGEGQGWYAIVVRNPLLEAQGVAHRRFLLYRPGRALIAIDEVRAEEEHEYARRFHFGPELEAQLDGERVELSGKGLAATLADFRGKARGEVELARGREEPSLLGWAYPGDRERVETWTAELRSRAAGATFAASLSLGRERPAVSALKVERAGLEVGFDDSTRLSVRLRGHRATVAER